MSATLLMFHPKCTHCGETFPAGAQFCVHCGKPIHASDEELGPPAQVRPLRPSAEDDSFRLPAPPSTSTLSPMATDSLLLEAPASGAPGEDKEEAASSRTPDRNKIEREISLEEESPKAASPQALPESSQTQAKDKAKDSWDEEAPSSEEHEEAWAEAEPRPSSPATSAESAPEEESEEEDDVLLVPPERSFRPWMLGSGALLALAFVVYLVWPGGGVEQNAPTPKPSPISAETLAPAPAEPPTPEFTPEEAPAAEETTPAKPQNPKRTGKPSQNSAAAPRTAAPKPGALKPSDIAPKLPLDDASPNPAPKENPAPNPSHTEAADEAADFLTGE